MKTKVLTEQERYEQQLQLEHDLQRLMREYSQMDRDRRAYTSGATGKLLKQKKVINILKTELKNLLTDLNVATGPAKVQKDQEITANLHSLLEEHDFFNHKIKIKMAHLDEVKDQIRQVKKEVCRLEANQISDIQIQDRVLYGNKTLEALENKLDVQIKKFCTIVAENRVLRQEIDHFLKERCHFNNMWERMIQKLNTGKKFMMDLIEQATIAYDQREEWCGKLQALRSRAHNDLLSQTEEMRELYRKMDHDQKLHDFMSVKCQLRIMVDLERKEMDKRDKQRDEMARQIKRYEEILFSIFTFTGHHHIDAITKEFKKREEENFSLFKYINMLNKEMEVLTDELGHLHLSIDEQRALSNARAVQQSGTLEKLKDELHDATKEANEMQAVYDKTQIKLNHLLAGIDRLFKICRCSNAPLLELLGNNSSINKYNVLLHLEILEKRITDMIIHTYFKEKTGDRKKGKGQGVIIEDKQPGKIKEIDKIIDVQPCPLCIQHEQVSDVIDNLQYALTKEEIQTKLNMRMKQPDYADRLHNVSACHLPESRQIIQKRYQ